MQETLDEPLFNYRAFDLHIDKENNNSNNIPSIQNVPSIPQAPPAPPLPPTQDNHPSQSSDNPLLNSISNFSKNKLKKATTITKKEFDRHGNIINVVT